MKTMTLLQNLIRNPHHIDGFLYKRHLKRKGPSISSLTNGTPRWLKPQKVVQLFDITPVMARNEDPTAMVMSILKYLKHGEILKIEAQSPCQELITQLTKKHIPHCNGSEIGINAYYILKQ